MRGPRGRTCRFPVTEGVPIVKIQRQLPYSLLTAVSAPLWVLMGIMFWRALLAASVFGMAVWGALFCGLLVVVTLDWFSRRRPEMKQWLRILLPVAFGLLPAVLFFGVYFFVARVLGGASVPRFLAAAVSACVYTFVWYVLAMVSHMKEMLPANRLFCGALALVLVLLLVIPCVAAPARCFEGFANVSRGGVSSEIWTKSRVFSSQSDTVTLEKQPGRDFVILNLADIQLTDMDFSPLTPTYKETFATIEALIRRVKPDLITVTGDTGCGYVRATDQIVSFIDHFGIPWAPIFGNHDHETRSGDPLWTAEAYEKAQHCLFRKGPASMGIGNYIITVTEEGRPVQALFMMDTHGRETYHDGSKETKGYGQVMGEQIAWYRWAVEGLAAEAGHTVPSTVFAHVPAPQFAEAFEAAWDYDACPRPGRCKELEGHYRTDGAFGLFHDSGVASAPVDLGFFDEMVSLGSTTRYVCGHDPPNSYSVPFKGIDLTYALHTGPGCYGEKMLNGGTVITVSSDGTTTAVHEYVRLP